MSGGWRNSEEACTAGAEWRGEWEDEGREGMGAGRAGPCELRGGLEFYPEGVGALEGCGQRKDQPRLRCSQVPSEHRWL